jgi:maltooligosyltrehalose trehalohydrolase
MGKPAHVMAESHDNDRAVVLPAARGGLGLDAVWADDFHHAVHVLLTGERGGYYVDFEGTAPLTRAMAEAFAYQGEHSEYFGRARGTPSGDLEGEHFVVCIQNHDQVGNRARGDRLGSVVPLEAMKLAAALMFVTPALPLLFMGEEYGETAPFQFFTSFLDRDLVEAVRRGRTTEFTRFAWQGTIPDPGDPATFVRSRLNHPLASAPRHRELREYYKQWLAVRRAHPALGARGKAATQVVTDAAGHVLTVTRSGADGARITLHANLSATPRTAPPMAPEWRILIDSAEARFGGPGKGRPLLPFQVLLYEAR